MTSPKTNHSHSVLNNPCHILKCVLIMNKYPLHFTYLATNLYNELILKFAEFLKVFIISRAWFWMFRNVLLMWTMLSGASISYRVWTFLPFYTIQARDILHSYSVVFWQPPDNTIFYDTILTDTNIFLVLSIIQQFLVF